MSYVTPAQMIDGPDSLYELSELFGVDAALLRAVVGNGDVAAWQEDDVAAAHEALDSIRQRIVQATGEVDARLAQRGYALPMDATRFPVLVTWARAVARYHLHPQREGTNESTGRIERDYRDAIRALDKLASGELSLGAGDPLSGQSEAAHYRGRGRAFSRRTLGGL